MAFTIRSLEFFPYEYTNKRTCQKRKGFICKLFDKDEKSYYGEAAPLEPWSKESYSEVAARLLFLQRHLKNQQSIPWNLLYPSVHFALLEAISLESDSYKIKPQQSHGLLMGTKEEILSRAAFYRESGYKIIKIKTKQLSLKEVPEILEELSPYFTLRIDANQKYSLSEAKALFLPFRESIDYIEEPLSEIQDLDHLELPFALDESLRLYPPYFPENPYLKAVIIRPTFSGARSRYNAILEKAKQNNLKILFSTCWESGIGLLQLIHLHQQYNSYHLAGAFDTLSDIHEPVFQEPLKQCGHLLLLDSKTLQNPLFSYGNCLSL